MPRVFAVLAVLAVPRVFAVSRVLTAFMALGVGVKAQRTRTWEAKEAEKAMPSGIITVTTCCGVAYASENT